MAPVPENNNKDAPSRDDSENFFNPDLTIPVGSSDSDDSDLDGEENIGAPGGYSLLPQEPDENGFESDDSFVYSTENIDDPSHAASFRAETSAGLADSTVNTLTESVLLTEEGAVAPTVPASTSTSHPAFIAKFPYGKIPSYMQVSFVPRAAREKEEQLWNQHRQEASKSTLDPVEESSILKAMSHFSLPTENIPDWARDLSDDQWQQQIVSRISKISDTAERSTTARPLTSPDFIEKSTDTKTAALAADDTWVAEFAEDTNSTDRK
ncbi:unnamed protein product [Candidula unifasciata]|uniref:Male-enhanced antigen 1 n=1 Tax=Candidula unifasciata TaxID=100452 RepID=A0A8S3YWP6_9EUPU|nr:unnamed protein product [Candidula unifasciata]